MQKDELVLSDVHLQVQSNQSKGYNISRFYYSEDTYTKKKKQVSAKTTDNGNLHRSKLVNGSLTDITQGIDKQAEVTTKDGTEGDEKTEDKDNTEMDRDIGGIEIYKDDKCIGEVKTDKDVYGVKIDKDICEVKKSKDVCKVKKDSDGDVEVQRRKRKIDLSVITIAHKMETTLENVGQQIWLASLLMADFIISHEEEFQGKRILDLGAGVGLTSVVAAMYADHVISTDIGKDIKELAQHNLDQNSVKDVNNFSVEELDWFENKYCAEQKIDEVKLQKDHEVECDIDSCDIIISADVIYDNNMTDALFRTVYGLMLNTSINTWYISTEKRYVFTLQDLDIACPAYQHFRECLAQLEDMSDHAQFIISCEEEFPQCFQYNRTKELELWKVTIKRLSTTK